MGVCSGGPEPPQIQMARGGALPVAGQFGHAVGNVDAQLGDRHDAVAVAVGARLAVIARLEPFEHGEREHAVPLSGEISESLADGAPQSGSYNWSGRVCYPLAP